MKNHHLAGLVPLLLMSLTPACGPVHPPVGTAREPLDPQGKAVTFTWSFHGSSCAQRPGISIVHLEINNRPSSDRDTGDHNEPLEDSGDFPCSAGGLEGVTLTRFSPGRYSYRLSASRPYERYQYEGAFEVRADDVVTHGELLCLIGSTGPC